MADGGEDSICDICQMPFIPPVKLIGCGHRFCLKCIANTENKVSIKITECPICHEDFVGLERQDLKPLKHENICGLCGTIVTPPWIPTSCNHYFCLKCLYPETKGPHEIKIPDTGCADCIAEIAVITKAAVYDNMERTKQDISELAQNMSLLTLNSVELEIPYKREVEVIENDLEYVSYIGSGGFGYVYLLKGSHNGEERALKVIVLNQRDEKQYKRALSEIALQNDVLKHPGIVRITNIFLKQFDRIPLSLQYKLAAKCSNYDKKKPWRDTSYLSNNVVAMILMKKYKGE